MAKFNPTQYAAPSAIDAADKISIFSGADSDLSYITRAQLNTVTAGITASTTQSQGNGALTADINEISTVANNGDTVTLPSVAAGTRVLIINHGTKTLQIFPASGDDLGGGANASQELEPEQSVTFAGFDSTNWHLESTTETAHATFLDEDNTDAFVINDAGGDTHAYHTNGLAAGELAGWTFDAGGAGTSFPIASVANSVGSPGSQILVTTTGSHGLAAGAIISQTNLSDSAYVGVFVVASTAAATTYEVAAAFTADGTGTMDEAATVTCGAAFGGDYKMEWWASASSATNNQIFDFILCNNAVGISGTKVRRKFSTSGDVGSVSGGALLTVTAGDKLSIAFSNTSSAGNITLRNLSVVVTKS